MKFNNHILFLIPGFPKDQGDFLCIPPVQDFLLKYKNVYPETKFSVIAFQYPFEKSNYIWNQIDVYALGGNNSVFRKFFIWMEAIKTAKRINKNLQIDSIHSNWFGECALIGNYLSKRLGCNHICTLMGRDVKPSNNYLRLLNKDRLKIISLSQNQSTEFHRITNRKVDREIFWGIDEQSFDNADREIDLLGVGSLIPLKNYLLFLKVVTNAVKSFPNIRCKLAGQGSELSMLKNMAKQNGIENNIEFTGLLSRKDIFNLMQQSKIFIHPSKFEGFGFVFAEALANGMNIVSFNVGNAKQSNKWFIAKDDNEFILLAKKLLSAKLNFEPLNIFPVSDTVDKYHQLYNFNQVQ